MSTAVTKLRGGGLALADQLVASSTTLLTGIIIGRACTPAEFGLYMLGFSIVLVLIRLQTSLISTPYTVFSPRLHGGEHARYTGSSLIHQISLSILAVFLLSLSGIVLSSGLGPSGLAPVVRALVFSISFILFREYARNVCFANLQFKAALIVDTSTAVVQIAGLLFLAHIELISANSAFWVSGVSCGLSGLVWFWRMRNYFNIAAVDVVLHLKRNWIFGRWILASVVLWESSVQVYPWFLAYFQDTASVGTWAACIGAMGIANPLVLGIGNYLTPRIAHVYSEEGDTGLRRIVLKSWAAFSFLIFPIAFLLMLFGGWIVVLFYGAKYQGNGLIVSVLALNLLLLPVQGVLSRALVAMERVGLEFATNLVSLCVLCLLGWWLVRDFGPLGAAYGTLCSGVALGGAKYATYVLALRSSESKRAIPPPAPH